MCIYENRYNTLNHSKHKCEPTVCLNFHYSINEKQIDFNQNF